MHNFLKTGLAVAALWAAVGAHAAQQDTANLSVTLTITGSCRITATPPAPVAFGSHAQTATGPINTGQGQITVTCVDPVAYNIQLGQGTYYSGGRRMNSGANFVPYELYRDAARTQSWGQTIGTNTVAGTGSATYDVYGQVPSVAFPAGVYSDTVLVTLDY